MTHNINVYGVRYQRYMYCMYKPTSYNHLLHRTVVELKFPFCQVYFIFHIQTINVAKEIFQFSQKKNYVMVARPESQTGLRGLHGVFINLSSRYVSFVYQEFE